MPFSSYFKIPFWFLKFIRPIINTCEFIESAKSESIQSILDIHQKRKPNSLLVMAGCLSERYKDELMHELKEVDIFTGVGDYDKIDEMVNQKLNMFSEKAYLIKDEDRVITNSTYHAYIKISEGCNQNCSFCAIPNFKGKLQSRDINLIVKEVQELVKRGYFDFSFVSQDSSSYLRDIGEKDGLIKLISEIDKIEGVKSARILYLYPSTTTFELIDAIKSAKKFHNYFDMPIQHISDSMLKIMKRGFGEDKTKELLNYMKKGDDSFIRTTFIVGHPQESDEDFQKMYDFISEFGFDRVNVFEYSNEENTSAYNMEQVDKRVVKKRVKEIEKLIKKGLKAKLKSEIGKEIELVIDKESDESEYLLSAKNIIWAPDIDGEIYVNDSEIDEELNFGVIYKAKITDVVDNKQLATVCGKK